MMGDPWPSWAFTACCSRRGCWCKMMDPLHYSLRDQGPLLPGTVMQPACACFTTVHQRLCCQWQATPSTLTLGRNSSSSSRR